MTQMGGVALKVAILDLNKGTANEGMRCIRELLQQFAKKNRVDLVVKEFEVRLKNEVPDLSFDIYISSGGPGNPADCMNSEWEKNYFNWIGSLESWNSNSNNKDKKHVFFICHSFQVACIYFRIGNVCKRKSTAFGVFPVHILKDGKHEPVFKNLPDPFYAVDFRDYQVIEIDKKKLKESGASILAIEKERTHIPLERAVMAIRFNPYMIGTQFHPEADAAGMSRYLQKEEKKKNVIENYGEEKWTMMLEQLDDPGKIRYTHNHLLPNFLQVAFQNKMKKEVFT